MIYTTVEDGDAGIVSGSDTEEENIVEERKIPGLHGGKSPVPTKPADRPAHRPEDTSRLVNTVTVVWFFFQN